jgi:hypothetical protein
MRRMPKTKLLLAILTTTLASAQTPSASDAVARRLVGAWELVSYEIVSVDGTKRAGAYDRGQITYDASGRMSAHLMNSSNKAEQTPQTD